MYQAPSGLNILQYWTYSDRELKELPIRKREQMIIKVIQQNLKSYSESKSPIQAHNQIVININRDFDHCYMITLPDLSKQLLRVKNSLVYYQCSASCVNKTSKIIIINPANIRLLHRLWKKKIEKGVLYSNSTELCVCIYTFYCLLCKVYWLVCALDIWFCNNLLFYELTWYLQGILFGVQINT